MKAIQDHELGFCTFPTHSQADVSPQRGGVQEGGNSRPVCACTAETVLVCDQGL